jgi:5-methylcytosine-specific restriction endonuclease McrA
MPNRIIKDSINESRGLTSCSFFAQDLYKRLITYADDYGRFNADPQIMAARLYPRELAVITLDDIVDGLTELAGVNKIGFYTSATRDEVYGAFPNWEEHQRVRDSKKRCPDPADTSVNDWYLRRFIPIDMKAAIIERDGFKCTICGKHVATACDAKKLVKMGSGMFHFDHIVPCNQGGRATMENLRLTCPKCNQSRKKTFSIDEIVKFAETCGNLPQPAAKCRLNPIQSESESESNPNPNPAKADDGAAQRERFDRFWTAYPRKTAKQDAMKAFARLNPDDALLDTILTALEKHKKSDQWTRDSGQYIPHPATWLNGKRWTDEMTTAQPRTAKTVTAQQYTQREYEDRPAEEMPDWLKNSLAADAQEASA